MSSMLIWVMMKKHHLGALAEENPSQQLCKYANAPILGWGLLLLMLPGASLYDVYEAYDVFVKDQVGVLLGGTQKYIFF